MKKYSLFISLSLLVATAIQAQNPISWSFKWIDKGKGEVELMASAVIDDSWHLYDITIPEGGPMPTSLSIDKLQGATKVGGFKAVNSTLHSSFDDIFQMQIGYYEQKASFVQRFRITDKAAFALIGDLRAQVCSETSGQCIPIKIDLSYKGKDLPASLLVASTSDTPIDPKDAAIELPEETSSVADSLSQASMPAVSNTDLWTSSVKELQAYGAAGSTADQSLLWIFIGGFLGGLLALLTPCVWPMIPMTVSFFLKRNKKNKKKVIREALTYGLAIIVIYVALGLLITGLFGASALNDLSTSAFFNLLFFALLVLFAISFMGAFELVLPSSWTNKIDRKADSTTGFISIFFMAFTLALVSFSCTGPIIGTLLVEAASSGAILSPAIGMFGFALALAIPFSLFAIFPSLLESMPKSGGWLNSVKVVLGFLELALAFKFLSVADLAYKWGILDREVFLVLWIVIFVLLGFYLLGKLKLAHDSDLKYISVPRLFMAIGSLAFAVYLVPGLWGAPLKSISAFAPPLFTQDFSLYEGAVHAKYDSYEEGMEYARKNNKPVIIDFSGYGCVNCRKMEAKVWTDIRVKNMLEQDYVLITLMVDDKTKLAQIQEVTEENGKTTKLKTIGDKWSYLQRHKFGINSQPYYVLLNASGKPIGPSYAYNEDIPEYIQFLNIGLSNFKKIQAESNK